jgi:hypothetical protein
MATTMREAVDIFIATNKERDMIKQSATIRLEHHMSPPFDAADIADREEDLLAMRANTIQQWATVKQDSTHN